MPLAHLPYELLPTCYPLNLPDELFPTSHPLNLLWETS